MLYPESDNFWLALRHCDVQYAQAHLVICCAVITDGQDPGL